MMNKPGMNNVAIVVAMATNSPIDVAGCQADARAIGFVLHTRPIEETSWNMDWNGMDTTVDLNSIIVLQTGLRIELTTMLLLFHWQASYLCNPHCLSSHYRT